MLAACFDGLPIAVYLWQVYNWLVKGLHSPRLKTFLFIHRNRIIFYDDSCHFAAVPGELNCVIQ